VRIDLLSVLFGGVAAGWFLFNLSAAWLHRYVPPFARVLERSPELDETPSVTVVIAARNERGRIEESVRRMLAQRGVDLELVVVDDRSTDGTREILERLRELDERLRVIRVDELPHAWLGKQHACHLGARDARGDWILFTDADTWVNPTLIAATVRAAVAERADLVCLLPAQKRISLWGRAAVLVFSLGLLIAAARANRDRRRSPVGIGAYNLVRTAAYRRAGGYAALRMEIIDDLKLGMLLERSGGRLRCWTAVGQAEMDWAASPRDLMRALEKNFFAMADLRFGLAAAAIAIMFTAWFAAIAGPFTGRWSGYAAFAGLMLMPLPAALFGRHSRWGLPCAILTPLIYPLLPWTLLRSTWLTWRQGGIRWRGTLYPLGLLREHLVPLFVRAPRDGAAAPLR
jgi:glycosyltransferase involved in cell wall biosynthesis